FTPYYLLFTAALRRGPRGLDTRLVAVDADHGRDVETELVEFVDEFFNQRRRPHLAIARADVVGFDEKLFTGKINHHEILGVGGRQRMDFDEARAVGQDSWAAPERFDDDGSFMPLQ